MGFALVIRPERSSTVAVFISYSSRDAEMVGQLAGIPPHPATLLLVWMQTADKTYTASLTIEAADPADSTFQADAEAMVTGFQMLPPAGR